MCIQRYKSLEVPRRPPGYGLHLRDVFPFIEMIQVIRMRPTSCRLRPFVFALEGFTLLRAPREKRPHPFSRLKRFRRRARCAAGSRSGGEMADTPVLGTGAERRAGSSPALSTLSLRFPKAESRSRDPIHRGGRLSRQSLHSLRSHSDRRRLAVGETHGSGVSRNPRRVSDACAVPADVPTHFDARRRR